jgi:hypothetical protein
MKLPVSIVTVQRTGSLRALKYLDSRERRNSSKRSRTGRLIASRKRIRSDERRYRRALKHFQAGMESGLRGLTANR